MHLAISVLRGVIISAATLLILTGASKLHRTVPNSHSDNAIRRALRVDLETWRRMSWASGIAEVVIGTWVCVNRPTIVPGTLLISVGLIFVALQLYAYRTGTQGDCGCIGWRNHKEPITFRTVLRAGWVLMAGILDVVIGKPSGIGIINAWVGIGLLGGWSLLLLLGHGLHPRSPWCHRPLWRPKRQAIDALLNHASFRSMMSGADQLRLECVYRRQKCVEEIWFFTPYREGRPDSSIVFRLRHVAHGGLAIHASVEDTTLPGVRGRQVSVIRAAPTGHGTEPGCEGDQGRSPII